jgi:hypothetical protein
MLGWVKERNLALRAAVERAAAPGYGTCLRCRRPWKFVEPHSTPYGRDLGFAPDGEVWREYGCFPLCEGCWELLGGPEERLPFYRVLWNQWVADGTDKPAEAWGLIEAAVMEGL